MVNTYVSCFSLAASQFCRRLSPKGFTPGEKPQHKMSYWDTGTCIFIYIFI